MFQFFLCVDNNVEAKIDIFLCKVFLFFDNLLIKNYL